MNPPTALIHSTDEPPQPISIPKAFDYVEDAEGWVYVVRGPFPMDPSDLIVKALYPPQKVRLGKPSKKSGIPIITPSLARPLPSMGSDLYLLSKGKLANHYCRFGIPIEEAPSLPDTLQAVATIIEDYNAVVFLYGSRRLGRENHDSDWDLLVKLDSSPAPILRAIRQHLSESVRPFSREEVLGRARRYAATSSTFDFYTLLKLFERTTWYLKTETFEIGLFFTRSSETPLDYSGRLVGPMFRDGNQQLRFLRGTPMPSCGGSYFMPRVVRFKLESSSEIELVSFAWELGGLEEAQGLTIRTSAGLRLAENRWWIDSGRPEIRISHG